MPASATSSLHPEFLSLAHAAARFDVSESFLRKQITMGALPALRNKRATVSTIDGHPRPHGTAERRLMLVRYDDVLSLFAAIESGDAR